MRPGRALPPIHLFRSFAKAFVGIGLLLREPNARIHVAATLAVTGAGRLLDLPALEWAIVIATIGLVLALETLNTALEVYVDLATPGRDEAAGRAKDAAAGAVLIASLAAVIVAAFILGPRLTTLGLRLGLAWASAPVGVGLYVTVTAVCLLSGIFWRGKWPK
jgi:diacylglycerol kinase